MMELVDVVRKLIGPIDPVGETRADEQRYKNLIEVCGVVAILLSDIEDVAANKGRPEHSTNKAGTRAYEFLREIVLS